MKESFIIYKSFYNPIKDLSFEDKGRLLDGIFQYQITGNIPDLPPLLLMAFLFMKNHFDRDEIKYQSICERNKGNGKKGGRPLKKPEEPKKPSGLFENPEEPKKPDNDNDNDNDNDIPLNPPKGEKIDVYPFGEFWNDYDKKVGDKEKLIKKWNKLSDPIKLLIKAYIPKYKESKPNKQFRKDPLTFLNNSGWEDEIIIPQKKHSKEEEYEAVN